jgi:hypothetical protein
MSETISFAAGRLLLGPGGASWDDAGLPLKAREAELLARLVLEPRPRSSKHLAVDLDCPRAEVVAAVRRLREHVLPKRTGGQLVVGAAHGGYKLTYSDARPLREPFDRPQDALLARFAPVCAGRLFGSRLAGNAAAPVTTFFEGHGAQVMSLGAPGPIHGVIAGFPEGELDAALDVLNATKRSAVAFAALAVPVRDVPTFATWVKLVTGGVAVSESERGVTLLVGGLRRTNAQ